MKELIKDLSTVTCVPYSTLLSIFNKIPAIIAHSVYESAIEEDEESIIDFGFGELIVHLSSGEARIRFVPSRKTEKMIKEAVETKTDPMIATLEESLKKKIEFAYKSLY